MERFKESLHRKHREADYPYLLETISKKVCAHYYITIDELKKRGRKNSRSDARALFCYLSHIKELVPQSVIARYLGTTISPIAVLVRRDAAIDAAVFT